MPPIQRRATLRDVAERSAVSYQTVSRVINNHPYVSPDKRARVLQAIEELGYRPNRAAQSLAGHRTQIIGVVGSGLDHFGPSQMVVYIERAAKSAGYDALFANMGDSTGESLVAALEHLRRWHPDGLLLITPTDALTHDEIAALSGGIPIVQVDPQIGAPTPSLVIDQRQGERLLIEHLLKLGHRDFVAINGPQTWHDAIARRESFRETLAAADLIPCAESEGDWSAASGYAAAQALLVGGVTFTALAAANDQMALGALRALNDQGIDVPGQVSVVGFDDIPEAPYFSPPLTTVRQDFALLGRLGVEYLMERIAHPDAAPVQQIVQPTLIVRESTAQRP
jgi:DNA-binding LacI/PurR family transcriptional regulator